MDKRRAAADVAANVAEAMTAAGVSPITLSQATGIPVSTLRDHLDGKSEFTWGETVDVGGFFRIPIARLYQGAAA